MLGLEGQRGHSYAKTGQSLSIGPFPEAPSSSALGSVPMHFHPASHSVGVLALETGQRAEVQGMGSGGEIGSAKTVVLNSSSRAAWSIDDICMMRGVLRELKR